MQLVTDFLTSILGRGSVDSVLSGVNKAVARLEAVAAYNDRRAERFSLLEQAAREEADRSAKEALKSEKLASKFRSLVEV